MVIGHFKVSRGSFTPMRFKELDGLRGIAAVLVVLAHFSTADGFRYLHRFSLANIAVVMFFGLSAFLLCYLAEKKFDTKAFITSRFFRIVPLYLVVLVVTLALATLNEANDAEVRNTWQKLWLILGFALNWSMVQGDPGLLWSFRHFWSLCVEIQLYLVIALAFPWLRTLKAWQVVFGALFAGITLRAFTLAPVSYYSTFAYIEVFAFCGLAGVAYARGNVLRVNVWPYAVLLLVLGFVWQRIMWKPDWQFVSGFFYPAIGAILAISLPNIRSRVLSHPALVSIGLWSYGIYLWHFPVRMFVEPFSSGPWSFFALYSGLTFLAAITTYRLVEKPINAWKATLGNRAKQPLVPLESLQTQSEGQR